MRSFRSSGLSIRKQPKLAGLPNYDERTPSAPEDISTKSKDSDVARTININSNVINTVVNDDKDIYKSSQLKIFFNTKANAFLFKQHIYGKKCISLTVIIMAIYIITSSWNAILWKWNNQYLYIGCPEIPLWTRPPNFASRLHPFQNKKTKTIQVSYLSGKFGSNSSMFLTEIQKHQRHVRQSGVFGSTDDNIHIHSFLPDFITNDPTWKRHLTYQNFPKHHSKRGGGYWFWKPTLILHHLLNSTETSPTKTKSGQQKEEEDSFLVYSDVDRVDFLSWLGLLLETMVERNHDLALEELHTMEKEWSKVDAYYRICNADNRIETRSNSESDSKTAPMQYKFDLNEVDDTKQYNGSFLIVRNTQKAVQFIQDWVELAKDYHLISDEPSSYSSLYGIQMKNAQVFKEHRHDQSLLSLLLKCNNKYSGASRATKEEFKWTCLGNWKLFTFAL